MIDWTYDWFYEDAKLYKATPLKGVHCASDASDRERFMVWFKNRARDFMRDWGTSLYDNRRGWIGDAFARELSDMCFSDYYKDTYGQRPHLSDWFYLQAVGLPSGEDTARMFCASPIEDAIVGARQTRDFFENVVQ